MSGAVFWCADVHVDKAPICIKYINKALKKILKSDGEEPFSFTAFSFIGPRTQETTAGKRHPAGVSLEHGPDCSFSTLCWLAVELQGPLKTFSCQSLKRRRLLGSWETR